MSVHTNKQDEEESKKTAGNRTNITVSLLRLKKAASPLILWTFYNINLEAIFERIFQV